MTIIKANLLSDEPLTDASPIYQALWWIAKGEFKAGSELDRAHDICQSDEGNKPYDWVHGLVHWIEGDEWNSNYWYRSIGEIRQGKTFEEEWQVIVDKLI